MKRECRQTFRALLSEGVHVGKTDDEAFLFLDELDDSTDFFCLFCSGLGILLPWYLKNSRIEGLFLLETFDIFPEYPKQGEDVSHGRDC